MSSPSVVLILAAGARIGSAVARKFASEGFQVVVASRSITDGDLSPEGYFQVQVDLFKPESVPRVFEVIKSRFGVPPNVVVYNGAFRRTHPANDPFSVPLETVKMPVTVCYESSYVAAQEALKGFAELPASTPKTFIVTGNALNQIPLPEVFPFAVAKRAVATLVEYGANAYADKGYRFYFVDERKSPDGRAAGFDVDGDAHGEMYWQLVQPGEQQRWLVTFTKEQGKVDYGPIDFDGVPYRPQHGHFTNPPS